jgi:hypothetical protein
LTRTSIPPRDEVALIGDQILDREQECLPVTDLGGQGDDGLC